MKKNDIVIIRNGSVARFIEFTKNDSRVVQITITEDQFGNVVNYSTLVYKKAIAEVIC